MLLFLAGSAATGLGNYESALEHLSAARAEMERAQVVWDWWWRMPIEAALTELWLVKGDLAPGAAAGGNVSSDHVGNCGTHLASAGVGSKCASRHGRNGMEPRGGIRLQSLVGH
jgi:hypothetical protein